MKSKEEATRQIIYDTAKATEATNSNNRRNEDTFNDLLVTSRGRKNLHVFFAQMFFHVKILEFSGHLTFILGVLPAVV